MKRISGFTMRETNVLSGKSLAECGTGRSIVLDNEDVIIAGNGVYAEAQALNLPVRVIETDGTELIAIKRTDLGTDDERRKALALADNHASDTSAFDVEKIVANFNEEQLKEWEFSIEDVKIEGENDPDKEFEENGEFRFVNKDNSAWKQLIVSFRNVADYEEFARITGLNLTDRTRSTYFPQQDKKDRETIYEQPE